MNKKTLSLLLGLLACACSFETGPRNIHVTGEYGLFEDTLFSSRKTYLLKDCATGDKYHLKFTSEVIVDLSRKSVAAGADPEETLLVELEASSTPDDFHVFGVTKIHKVRRGSCKNG